MATSTEVKWKESDLTFDELRKQDLKRGVRMQLFSQGLKRFPFLRRHKNEFDFNR